MSEDQTPGTEGAAERFEVALPATAGQPDHVLSGFRYGIAGARPKAYLQAGLHADELPGMFVLHRLRGLFDAAAAQGGAQRFLGLVPDVVGTDAVVWPKGDLEPAFPDIDGAVMQLLMGRALGLTVKRWIDGGGDMLPAEIRAAAVKLH